jgi:hypothetical protein
VNYSIAIFSKSILHKPVEYINSYDEFTKYTVNYDEIFSIVENDKSKLSFNQAVYIKSSLNDWRIK